MIWILFFIVLGVAEIATIGQLHELLGTLNLVFLYVVTTAIGAFFLFLKLPKFRASMKLMKKAEKKLKHKIKEPGVKLSAKEIEQYGDMIFVGSYFMACVLIAIPGVVSDVAGMLIVMPFLSDWVLKRKINKAIAKAKSAS